MTRNISARDRFYVIVTNVLHPGNGNYTLQVTSTPQISTASTLTVTQRDRGDETVALPGYLAIRASSENPHDHTEQMMFDMLLGEFLLP